MTLMHSGANITAGNIDLQFEASEWFAILELARKYHTTAGAVLRIGAVALLDADRRGDLHISPTIDRAFTNRKVDA